MLSKTYDAELRRKIVSDFVSENNRIPSDYEMVELMRAARNKYASIDQVGFVGFDMTRPNYTDNSSASMQNDNVEALSRDQMVFRRKVIELSDRLENGFRGFASTVQRTRRHLSQLESRVDNLLLLQDDADIFVAGIEEDFVVQDKIDYSLTDAAIEDGYCTLGRSSYTPINLDTASIRFSLLAPRGVIAKRATNRLDSLKRQDGTFWEYIAYTDYKQGRMTLVLEVELEEATDVEEIKLGLNPIAANSGMTASCLYSVNGSTFSEVDPIETPVDGENVMFNVGVARVKKLQVLLTKNAHDSVTPDFKQNVYLFSIDSLVVRGASYKPSLYSTLVSGPYDIYDVFGNEVYYTKGKIISCAFEPDDTSIDFYLSNDGTTWKAVSHDGLGLNYAVFGDGTPGDTAGYLNSLLSANALIEDPSSLNEVDFQTECLLNQYVAAGYATKVPLQSVVIRRNIIEANRDVEINKAVAGWMLDPFTNRYKTTVYIEALEGREFDFGPKSVWVNGVGVSGFVRLRSGYSEIEVSDANWSLVTSSLTDLTALKAADPLYPYNHKLIIEGYEYDSAFSGDRLYTGVDSFFGKKLSYLPPDIFAYLTAEDPEYYTSFTTEEVDDQIFFKIKVDKTDTTWSSEVVSVDWVVQRSQTNQVWVKALLSSSVDNKTPILESFKVQVI